MLRERQQQKEEPLSSLCGVKTPFGKKIFGFETKKHMADGHVSFKQLLLLYFTVAAISLSVTEVIVRAFLLPSVIYINFSDLLSGL